MRVNIGVSARHVHLNAADFATLFGDEDLKVIKKLSQPGEFASNLKVTLQTEKDELTNVRVLGPIRAYTQVEISKTDAFKLGLNPPIRDSGDIKGSSPITVIGTKGTLFLNEGCIIATRHIHLTNEDVLKYNLKDLKKVSVKVGGIKGGILNNITLKVSDNYAFELHLDTDDANAHLIKQGDTGEILIGGEYEESI
ncbi:MAG: phosphate propanoyltransferase [Bacilli bacterium]|nr:phosphate propanoyltransferase [Bacilli bacterium]